jgi:HEXXH motif-containing protein
MSIPEALLALPARGDRTVAGLADKVARWAARQLLSRRGDDLPPALSRALVTLQVRLAAATRADPGRLFEAVGCPEVLAPLLATCSGACPPADGLARAAPALLAALGWAQPAVTWSFGPIGSVPDPARDRVLRLSRPAATLTVDAEGLVADRGTSAARRLGSSLDSTISVDFAFHEIRDDLPGVRLATFDANPLAMLEAHPEKSGNAIDLGGRDVADWIRALAEALELVRIALPAWWEELPHTLRRLVPVGFDDVRHLSASYREAPFIVYLTLHPDPLTLAEAIVHEVQHCKLNLLTWFDPVLDNAYTEWTESPVRPDLRPVMGVLLAVHAFVPVAALHEGLARQAHPIAATSRFRQRRAQVLAGNARGLAIVQRKGAPTPTGRRILEDLARAHEALVAAAGPLPGGLADALPPG